LNTYPEFHEMRDDKQQLWFEFAEKYDHQEIWALNREFCQLLLKCQKDILNNLLGRLFVFQNLKARKVMSFRQRN